MLVLAILQAAVAGPMIEKPRQSACGSTAPDGALIVCGAGQGAHRLGKLPDRYDAAAAAIPKAQTNIAGVGTLSAEAEKGEIAGFPTNRAMVRLKNPF